MASHRGLGWAAGTESGPCAPGPRGASQTPGLGWGWPLWASALPAEGKGVLRLGGLLSRCPRPGLGTPSPPQVGALCPVTGRAPISRGQCRAHNTPNPEPVPLQESLRAANGVPSLPPNHRQQWACASSSADKVGLALAAWSPKGSLSPSETKPRRREGVTVTRPPWGSGSSSQQHARQLGTRKARL